MIAEFRSYVQLPVPGTVHRCPVQRDAKGRGGRPRLVARPDASDRRPAGEGERTCGACGHCGMDDARGVEKCELTRTAGITTDIAATDAACTHFEHVWEGTMGTVEQVDRGTLTAVVAAVQATGPMAKIPPVERDDRATLLADAVACATGPMAKMPPVSTSATSSDAELLSALWRSGCSRARFARALGRDYSDVRRWANGKRPLPKAVRRVVRAILRDPRVLDVLLAVHVEEQGDA